MPSFKSGLAAAVVAAALIAPLVPATAQNTDVIAKRQQLMKNNAREARAANAMIKGEEPFDAAKATEILRAMNTDAKAFGALFPEDSKTGGDTKAAAAIWEKPAEFEAANAKFVADTQAALDSNPADAAAFQTAFAGVAANCQSCHQQFRTR